MLPSLKVFEYNAKDCVGDSYSYEMLLSELQEVASEWRIYNDIAIPLTNGVMRMRNRGMPVDPIRRAAMIDEAHMKMEALQAELQRSIGSWFMPSNRNHISRFLFDIKGHTPLGYTKVRQQPRVDKETFITILLEHGEADPIYETLTDYLDVSKYCSTFLEGIKLASNNRAYTYWLVHGTATGRLSSRKPDMQNLPKEEPRNARNQFVAGRRKVFVAADASQLELRLMAYASHCTSLIEALEQKKDLHSLTAASAYQIPLLEVTSERRKIAKGYRYAESYGAGDDKVRQQMLIKQRLRLALSEIARIRAGIMAAEPEIYTWRDRKLEELKITRKSINGYGRIRRVYVPELDLRGIAFNSDMQSTAADYINKVFIKLDQQGAPIVCQVHDDIILEVPVEEKDLWLERMKAAFEEPQLLFGRELVLPCDLSEGEVWGHLKKVG